MPEKRNIDTKMGLDSKKSKTEINGNGFIKVGDAVNQLDDQSNVIHSDSLRTTGAEDSRGRPVQEIDSLCMNCHQQGVTKLLLTSIPHFRDVIVMSFTCEHCGFHNNEIQPASEIQEKGVKYVVQLTEPRDLNREVAKTDSCTCRFAELDVEIPPRIGQLTTIEGLLTQILTDIEKEQPLRREQDENTYKRIEAFLDKLRKTLAGENYPFTFIADDPSGNSWVEFIPGEPFQKWSKSEYFRTIEQTRALGMTVPDGIEEEEEEEEEEPKHRNSSSAVQVHEEANEIENLRNEVHSFPATCPACFQPCETKMKIVNIPHFKDVIIMSTVCDHCNYKSNEVKTGGEIPEKGRKIVLKVEEADDLSRDILKSETCGLTIPELNLDLTPGTLGGRFTTLEGLLGQVHDELTERVFNETSDSMDTTTKGNWTNFLNNLDNARGGNMQFTVIMEDPLAASYIQNVFAPDEDPNMEIIDYERTKEENESLGLNDMKV